MKDISGLYGNIQTKLKLFKVEDVMEANVRAVETAWPKTGRVTVYPPKSV